MIKINSKKDLLRWLKEEDKDKIELLFHSADQMRKKYLKNNVFFRGIIEISNVCEKNCYYCGIRKDNKNINRFIMTDKEIIKSAQWAYKQGYGSIVIQSGERTDDFFIKKTENLLYQIKDVTNGKLGITLSLGEQNYGTYERWRIAGAHRYLLRIEASDKELYRKLHPITHSFEKRLSCLKMLKSLDYQVGTGVMIGLPFQTIENLANDIIFFKDNDIDMIGMGPYVIHEDTPLRPFAINTPRERERKFQLSIRMIALTRLLLKDVNIAATTALQALNPFGREIALHSGANIIMPVITEKKYRKDYLLYENKPCIDENPTECKNCLQNRIIGAGYVIVYNKWGDSPHFFNRTKH